MATFEFMKQLSLMEEIGSEKVKLLQKVQYIMAKEHGINSSLHGWMNFFSGTHRLISEDDNLIIEGLKSEGYIFEGGWDANKDFWSGIITKKQYDVLTSLAEHVLVESHNVYNLKYWTDKEIETLLMKLNNLIFTKNISEEKAIQQIHDHAMNNYSDMSDINTKDKWIEASRELLDTLRDEIQALPMEEATNFITQSDYETWLRVIKEEGDDRSVDLRKRSVFTDIAFEVLDNDPLLDSHPVSDKTKSQIVNTLWKMCCGAHNKK
jgi:hypothetical protein